jgi:hypothetical protein
VIFFVIAGGLLLLGALAVWAFGDPYQSNEYLYNVAGVWDPGDDEWGGG